MILDPKSGENSSSLISQLTILKILLYYTPYISNVITYKLLTLLPMLFYI